MPEKELFDKKAVSRYFIDFCRYGDVRNEIALYFDGNEDLLNEFKLTGDLSILSDKILSGIFYLVNLRSDSNYQYYNKGVYYDNKGHFLIGCRILKEAILAEFYARSEYIRLNEGKNIDDQAIVRD